MPLLDRDVSRQPASRPLAKIASNAAAANIAVLTPADLAETKLICTHWVHDSHEFNTPVSSNAV
jgi:hypothetical protein